MIAATHTMGKAIPVVYSLQFFYGGCCLSSLFPAVLATCCATFNAENFIPTPPQLCTSITLSCTFLSWHCMTTMWNFLISHYAIGLMSKTTTLHMHGTFWYIFLLSLHDNDVKWPNFKFIWERGWQGNNYILPSLSINLGVVPSLQLQPKCPSFKHSY